MVQKQTSKFALQYGGCGGLFGFPFQTILVLLHLLVGILLYHKYRLNWQSGFRGMVKNTFSDQHNFSYFQIAQLSKIGFQNGSDGDHFGFPIGIILAILPTCQPVAIS